MIEKIKKINNKIKMIKDKKYFNAPLNKEGREYWIPVVVKNKSYLLGFIEAFATISEIHDISISDTEIALSSDRFNDILMDGSRIQNLSRNQLKEKIKKIILSTKEEHEENSEDILKDYLLSVSCPNCGMFYGFKTENEIPEKDFQCNICDNMVIIYTNVNDDYFDFDGKSGDIEQIVEEISKEED